MLSDLPSIFQWWIVFFLGGIIFTPITSLIFPNFIDRGYIFAKIIAIALISYVVFVLGFFKILSFETQNIFLIAGIFAFINFLILKKGYLSNIKFKPILPIFVAEELIFVSILLFWSFIHAHQPEIHGLEKYMDYGFINSILRSEYFPPKDMWLTPFYINYYYFGHLATAVLTKLSFLPSSITFNLMLSTIAALSFTASFSIGANLTHKLNAKRYTLYAGGLLTAFILNFAGSLHSIYLFFKPYPNENPVPFWQLAFSPNSFPNSYWYPNATRFIENTIHEFPLYSYVVSDLHGHVLDIPFVLFTIALLLSIFFRFNNHSQIQNSKLKMQNYNSKLKIFNYEIKLLTFNFSLLTLLLAFLLAIMYMTNAWDGIIYFMLASFIIGYIILRSIFTSSGIQNSKFKIQNYNSKAKIFVISFLPKILLLGLFSFIFTLPFNINFRPFASGIGILCAPQFLTDIGKFGPFLFETDHCQRSLWWQMIILYGFFYFWVISFIIFRFVILSRIKIGEGSRKILRFAQNDIAKSDIFIFILIIFSTLLIIIPEFIYVKDIYPAHYRANTMFKLVYQSFIMLSIASGYIITRIIVNLKFRYWLLGYWVIGLLVVFVVFLYPYFAINSYFGDLKTYHGLNGINYLKPLYPNDYEAILWINKNIKGQPVILEAQGDSYTDYGRVSTNTGLPTVLGWAVHEWLWRGTYDIPSPRIEEVQKMYESKDAEETKKLLDKYKVSLIFLGDLEKQKYTNFNEKKIESLGKIIYKKGNTTVFKID